MSPLILALLGVLSVGALGFAFAPGLLGSGRADKRRKALKGDYQATREKISVDRSKEDRRKSIQNAVKSQAEALEKNKKKRVPLKTKIFQSGMTIKPGSFIRNMVIVGALVFVTCFFLGVPLIFAAVFGVAGGYVLPMWFLSFKRARYQDKFLDLLPEAIEAIVRGIKSGMPLNDSIRVVAQEVKEPVKTEFKRVLEQQAVGKTMMEAIEVIYERIPLPEVNFLVVVINVQQQSGGNLSEALSNLSVVLRNRKKIKMKIKAMSSEAKASAMIIGALPFVVAGLVTMVTPGYLTPLFTSTLGHIWLGVGFVMFLTGGFIMNRMVKFNY